MVSSSFISLLFVLLFSSFSRGIFSDSPPHRFIQCLTRYSKASESITKVIYTPANSSYNPILQYTLQNLRFNTSKTRKPLVIVTPIDESQVQTLIFCARKIDINLRIRSGGHDFEGLSYRAEVQFVMLDMINFGAVKVDTKSGTAWVQAGVTLGELYYKIAQESDTLAFPAGLWSTVGVTGLIGEGGYGMMKRKYGLAADNTIDVHFIDVNGKIHDRKSMGEDLFWAIRGGGPSSFGVVLEWKIKLVPVPKIVTIFRVYRILEQNGSKLFQKWQSIAANEFPRDLDLRCVVDTILSSSSTREDKKTVRFQFQSLFLGKIDSLLPIMQKKFPELGLVREDCTELSWIQSAVFFANFTVGTSLDILLDRFAPRRTNTKIKSSFVKEPISEEGLKGIWNLWLNQPVQTTIIRYTPFGGKMNEYSESALPFPHRPSVLYMVNMAVIGLDLNPAEKLKWIDDLFKYYAPYVAKNPRTSYVNYRDLDLGTGSKTYAEASIWGKRYYKNNFDRLIKIKLAVDPTNFFRHKQSIPLLQK